MRYLERLGQRVIVANDGKEAVDYYANHGGEIDLLLLDLSMPVMDGKEAMKEIRALNSSVPIIICSGFPAEDIAKGFGSDQPDFFLQKPFASAQLKEAPLRCIE